MDLLLCMVRNEKMMGKPLCSGEAPVGGTQIHKHVLKINNDGYDKGPMTVMSMTEQSYE